MQPAREFAFTDRDFTFLARLINDRTGIVLGEQKRDLVYGRLAKRLRQLRLNGFDEYCTLLTREDAEIRHVINAITTNHTAFFREPHHFTHLEELLPTLKAPRLRLWSAACSIGAETYSMAMCLLDALPDAASRDIRILATDIDTQVLARAAKGEYPANMRDSIPEPKRGRYTAQEGDALRMLAPLRRLITFNELNLLEPWPMQGKFDIIFCRNVVIYFDKPTQQKLFDRFAEALTPGGWLYIGHSESLHGVSDRFRLAGKTIYQRTDT